jgi:hypothetical protein
MRTQVKTKPKEQTKANNQQKSGKDPAQRGHKAEGNEDSPIWSK